MFDKNTCFSRITYLKKMATLKKILVYFRGSQTELNSVLPMGNICHVYVRHLVATLKKFCHTPNMKDHI